MEKSYFFNNSKFEKSYLSEVKNGLPVDYLFSTYVRLWNLFVVDLKKPSDQILPFPEFINTFLSILLHT